MAIYEAAIRTSATTSGVAVCELRAGTGRTISIREIGIFNAAATAGALGLGRPASAGTASGTVLGQAVDPRSAAALGSIAATWSAAPTAPTIYLRRISFPATIGAGVVWGWQPDQLALDATASILLWSQSTLGVLDVYWKWEE